MAEYVDAFGERVKRELLDRTLGPYDVESRSQGRISHMTVRRMMQGNPPSSDHIVAFTEAIEGDSERVQSLADELLELAGKALRYSPVNGQVAQWGLLGERDE